MDGGTDATLVHFIIGSLYIAFPMLFLALASSSGLKISHFFAGLIGQMESPASSAGQETGGIVKSASVSAVHTLVS